MIPTVSSPPSSLADGAVTPAKLSSAVLSGLRRGHTGLIAPMDGSLGSVATTDVASRSYYARFVPRVSFTATKIGFMVTGAHGADDNCSVALYSSSLARLVVSATTAGLLNTTGKKTVSITGTPLTAGTVYYAGLGLSTFGGAAGSLLTTNFGNAVTDRSILHLFGTTAGLAEGAFQSSALTPDPAVLQFNNGQLPYLTVEE